MTNEQAKKMLKAKLECLKHETSGFYGDCNRCNCDECSLNYEQGNMGEQKKALDMAIKALEQTSWILVSERSPKDSGEYLVSVIDEYDGNYKAVGVAWFAHKKDYDIKESEWRELGIDGTVIAWMPLPEPY